jgi:hypothetical protein
MIKTITTLLNEAPFALLSDMIGAASLALIFVFALHLPLLA